MNPIHVISGGVFRWVLQASWQAAVLAALVLIVQLIFRKKLSPGWRYGLWLLVILRLVMPAFPQTAFSVFNFTRLPAQKSTPVPSLVVALQDDASPVVERRATGVPSPVVDESLRVNGERANGTSPSAAAGAPAVHGLDATKRKPVDGLGLLVIAWLAGVAAMSLRVMLAGARFRSRMRKAAAVSDSGVLRVVDECARLLGLRQRVILIETGHVDSPSVWGLWRKRLLLPRGSLERFSAVELRYIFLHEMAHLKRRDLELNWLAGMLQILHWFNPVLWFAFARMRADRELATDALALKHASGSEDVRYGETILKVLEGLSGNPLRHGLVGIAESKARMRERLVAIVDRRTMRPWRWAAAGIAAALAIAGLTDAQQSSEAQKKNAPQRAGSSESAGQKHFTIRVMDFNSGTPLSDAVVNFTLDYIGKDSKKQAVTTGQDGRARIEFSAGDLKRLAYKAEKAGYLPLTGQWFNQRIPLGGDECEIRLAQGIEIGGAVTDETGKPIPGGEISFEEGMGNGLSMGYDRHPKYAYDQVEVWSPKSGEPIATTDAGGRWRARCVHPSETWVSLRIHHPDYADVISSTQISSAMEAEGKGVKVDLTDLRSGKVTIKLSRGVAVTGRVVSEAGPLKGITVDAAELISEPHRHDRLSGHYTATTDEGGQFHFEHMPSNYLYFSIQKDGYAPAFAELNVRSPAGSPVEMHLTPGRKFLGRIVDNQSNAVPGAHVSFADFSTWRGIHWESVSDANGRIEWEHAPSEKFVLEIERDGFITQQRIVQATSDQEVKIRINPTLRIAGKVMDAESKQPVKDFHVDWIDRFDVKDFEMRYPYTTIAGSNGVYMVDVGRLYGNTWAGGYAHQCCFRVEADGYAPFYSRTFNSASNDVGKVTYDVELQPASQISGQVVDSDGHPVAAAQVALKIPGARLLLNGCEPYFSNPGPNDFRLTDASGRFRLNANGAAGGLVAVSEKGFAAAETNELTTNMTVRLKPWGRIEGVVWDYDKLVTNQGVWASAFISMWPESLGVEPRTNSDDHGRFAFPVVPPGKYRVYRMIPMPNGGASGGAGEVVRIEPGAIVFVKVGGEGRPVIGRLHITNPYVPIEWQDNRGINIAQSVLPKVPEGLKPQEFEAWRNRPEIEKAFDEVRNYPIQMAADGSFRMDEVVPGKYEIQLRIYDPRDPDAMAFSKFIIDTTKAFEVPQSDSHEPLDIGTIDIAMKPDIKKGETAAPEIEGTDMGGKKFKLSDFRGKYVLMDFWATWCGPCIAELPYLRQVHDKYKDRKDFVVLSVSIDKTINEPRDFLKKNDVPWMQGFLGGEFGGVPAGYGVEGIPSIFLISPDGKIIETELRGDAMVERVGKRLGQAVTYKTN